MKLSIARYVNSGWIDVNRYHRDVDPVRSAALNVAATGRSECVKKWATEQDQWS